MKFIIKFAMNNKHVIGLNGTIPWHCSQDLQDFKKETVGNIVVMGRKTYESLNGPLPKRFNIVVSLDEDYVDFQNKNCKADNVIFLSSLTPIVDVEHSVLYLMRDLADKDVYFIGGAMLIHSVIRQYAKLIDEVQISLINNDVDGDTFINPGMLKLVEDKLMVKQYE